MIELKAMAKPQPSPFEGAAEAVASAPVSDSVALTERIVLNGAAGSASQERSRALDDVAVKGRRGPISSPFESVLGIDERVRILDTDLSPWRMICALRMRGATGAGAIGTGWFIGPKTLLTAGHCVHSKLFFNGWAQTIEVIPGMNSEGAGSRRRPFGSVTAHRFSSVDRWIEKEDADFDIGCIHLEEPLGDKTGWFTLAALTSQELPGFLVNVSGYPADRGRGAEQYHHRNRILQVTDRRIFYEVDTAGGQSGAPVWVHETENGPPIAVGIHAYGIGGTPAALGIAANSAPRIIPEVLVQVQEWLKQDGGVANG
jgi:V8-like Glu-specific endopeptidase